MFKNLMQFTSVLFCLIMAVGCGSQNSQTTEQTKAEVKEEPKANLVGSDRDDHGCIGSAGYQWSELLKDCIRPFEKGVKLASATTGNSGSAAYLVFNADSTKIEVFMKEMETRPILSVSCSRTGKIWKSNDAANLSVSFTDGKWDLSKGNMPLYVQE